MLKLLFTALCLTQLVGCASSYMSEANIEDAYVQDNAARKQFAKYEANRDTSYMSQYDKQKYYADRDLGPIPVQPNYNRPNNPH